MDEQRGLLGADEGAGQSGGRHPVERRLQRGVAAGQSGHWGTGVFRLDALDEAALERLGESRQLRLRNMELRNRRRVNLWRVLRNPDDAVPAAERAARERYVGVVQ